jgi:hypothetical protein
MLIYVVLSVVVLIVVVLGVCAGKELSNVDISTEAGSSVQGLML